MIAAVRPDGHGVSWEALSARKEQIRGWVGKDGLSIVKVEELLADVVKLLGVECDEGVAGCGVALIGIVSAREA
ncbi:MAG: hypothetical protein WCF33_21270 [Pseudonocardiaceae bacterium]